MAKFLLKSDIDEVCRRIADPAQAFAGKSILLTGSRGFLGRYFVEIFARLNESVLDQPVTLTAFDNLITSGQEGASIPEIKNMRFVIHDVTKPFKWEGSLDFVIHAAGIASPYYYRAYPLETLEVAITGTRRMLELAEAKSARFVFFSSSEIPNGPF